MTDQLKPAQLSPGALWHSSSRLARHVLAALVAAMVLALLLYRDTAWAMVEIWMRSETFAHGFVVPLMSVWLAWRKREELLACQPRPNWWMLVPILAAGALWLLGVLAYANSPSQFALVVMLIFLVPAIAGMEVTRALVFPLAFLLFAVPMGEFLLPNLMESTANFVVLALRLTGIPVYQVGQELVIPTGNWSVVEACSGIRYLIASLMVGTLYAYLSYRSWVRRVAFVVLAGLVPILANWLRAYIIVMLGHLSGNRLATGVDHLIYGWIFFGVVMAVMFWVGGFWNEHPPATDAEALRPRGGEQRPSSPVWAVWLACALTIAILAMPRVGYLFVQKSVNPAPVLLDAPAASGNWQPQVVELTSWRPAYQGAAAELFLNHGGEGKPVGVYVGYYRNQSFGHKMVTSTNTLVRADNPEWKTIAHGEREFAIGGKTIKVKTSEMVSEQQRKKITTWRWYWVEGFLTSDDYLATAYLSLMRLLGKGDDSAVIIAYQLGDRSDQTAADLAPFLTSLTPALEQSLQRARGH